MDLLTEEQKDIFDAYKEGKNLFITGPGGCGKSFLIKTIVNDAKLHNINVDVCALTGCAAVLLNCNAKTLHSWAGIGLAKTDDISIINKISLNRYKKANWRKAKLLIIDEISMMSKRLFNLLDAIGKSIRKNGAPFGGIQVIFSGDFYQLPPVGSNDDPDSNLFCFESELWDETFDYQFILDKVFRQSDERYVNVLNEIRQGKLSKQGLRLLNSCIDKSYDTTNIVKPVSLFPIKKAVEIVNFNEMNRLTGDVVEIGCIPDFIIPPDPLKKYNDEELEREAKNIINNSMMEEKLRLKVGSQVMCIVNIDVEGGICNGSTGIVTEFIGGLPKVKFSNGRHLLISRHCWMSDVIAGYAVGQVPLILAWAVTIHKSQGASLESAEIDVGSSVFAPGQTYVALSRVKSIDGLYLKSFSKRHIKCDKKVIEFYKRFYEDSDCESDETINKSSEDEDIVYIGKIKNTKILIPDCASVSDELQELCL